MEPSRSTAGRRRRELLALALEHATNPGSRIHGLDHWRRVSENGASLAALTPGADPQVVAAFAAFHDSQRHNDGRDPWHGARAAQLVETLDLGVTPAQLETLRSALVDHDRGLLSIDPTIGCCWDADRLDLTRLGIRPQPRLLSTIAARERAA